jgi:hypothetical protein
VSAHITIGSDGHKELFCREFIDTHARYTPDSMAWPELDGGTLARLRAMPFWKDAIATERDVARKVQALVPLVHDPLLNEAIALQGYEEARHAALLETMLEHYEIPLPPIAEEPLTGDAEWNFIRTGYGECFDSFFAFGLYVVARDSGLFPAALLAVMEPVVHEEARHILFFVNWIAYRQARQSFAARQVDRGRCALAMGLQVWTRIQTARGAAAEEDFMLGVGESLDLPTSPREVLEVCLRENERRLGAFDPRLLRPRFVPSIARAVYRVLPGRKAPSDGS